MKLAAILVFLLSVTSSALAQDDTSRPSANITVHTFGDADRVVGDRVAPLGDNLVIRRRLSRESLLRIRDSFVPELYKSVEAH